MPTHTPRNAVPIGQPSAPLGFTRPHPDPNPATLAHRVPPEPLLIDGKAAAQMLGMSERKLHELMRDGVVPSRKVGRLRLYSPAELRAWIAAGCPDTPIAATPGGAES